MLTMNLVPILLTLILAIGQLALHPDYSAAAVAKVGEKLQVERVTPDLSPDAPLSLHQQLREADTPTPVAASDAFIRVANAPQAPATCSEKWEKTVTQESWRCIDGFWYKIDFEQWTCKKPQQTIDHTHQQRTQDACSTP